MSKKVDFDFEEIKKSITNLYKPFPCACGGVFTVSGQATGICPETKKFADIMTYTCNKCGKTTTQTQEVGHLNKETTDEQRREIER